jgi:carboxyl-terminal processing protease
MQAFIHASRSSRRVLAVNGKQVGYFRLWAARDAILQELKEAVADFDAQNVDALAVDLRGGYGGTSQDYLAPLRTGAHVARMPKYFLVDEAVRSGKEMLAAIIKKEKLGVLVGSRTAGAFLGGVPVRLHARRRIRGQCA